MVCRSVLACDFDTDFSYTASQIATIDHFGCCNDLSSQQLLTKNQASAQVVLSDGIEKELPDMSTPDTPLAVIQGIYADHASHLYQFLQFTVLVIIGWTLLYGARQMHKLTGIFRTPSAPALHTGSL